MKLRKWHLFFIACTVFVIVFFVVNGKYDPFYRVKGIDSDNRALIETYLDEYEQEYLIQNVIAMDAFVEFIDIPEFYLPYYQYYNKIDDAKIYNTKEELVVQTNLLVNKLTSNNSDLSMDYCEELIHNDLVEAYLEKDNFNMQYISYYQIVRTIYDEEEFRYIDATNQYVYQLEQIGVEDLTNTLDMLTSNYNVDSLDLLMSETIASTTTRVFNPSDLTTIVNSDNYIASYQPDNLVTALGIDRLEYTMFLQKDAYDALLLMYDDLYADVGSGLLLTKAYRSYELTSLTTDTEKEVAGYNEFQLGTTIEVQEIGESSEEFIDSDLYKWLVDNSYKYGYILRYPSSQINVDLNANTFRYVGVDIATVMHDQNLTLEQYNEIEQ